MPIDNFETVFTNDSVIKSLKLLAGARKAFQLTPSDTVDEPYLCRAIHVNTDGTIRVLLADDTIPVDLRVYAGTVYNIRVKRLYVTGTDSGMNIVGIE